MAQTLEPIARTGAAMVVVGSRMYVWGGYTQIIEGEGDDRFIVDIELPDPDEDDTSIEVLDIEQRQWHKYITKGSVPYLGKGCSVTAIGSKLHLFGGWKDTNFSNHLFILDTNTYTWERVRSVAGGPAEKYCVGIVSHDGRVIVFGGTGKPIQSRGGAQYVPNMSYDFNHGFGWNNELHEFNPTTKLWKELSCTGSRPPPVSRGTFNKIDKTRALFFGGRQDPKTTYSSVHILDFKTLHWTGPFEPQSPAQPWPPARCLHTSCCLVDPSSEMASHHQKLITIWGKGSDDKHVNDVWVLDVASMTWKKLNLNLRARMWHMSCSYHHGEMQTDVIVFGGNKRRQSKFERHVMTDLRILRFGAVQDLQEMCIAFVKKNWEAFKSSVMSQLPIPLQEKVQSSLEAVEDVIYPTASDFVV